MNSKLSLVALLLLCMLLFSLAVPSIAEENKITGISISESEAVVYTGKSFTLKTTIEPANAKNKKVEWESSDEQIATVTNGRINGKQNGECDIICRALDGSGVEATCHVIVKTEVKNITIHEKQIAVMVGSTDEANTAQLTYTVNPEEASWKDVVWSSSDENIATVDADGVIKGVSKGRATVYAASTQPDKKVRAQVQVTVNQAVESIEAVDSVVVQANKTSSVKATVIPSTASNKKIEWISEDESIASVNQNGIIRGKSYGRTTVVAKAADGSNITHKIDVLVIDPVLSVTLDGDTYDYGLNVLCRATLTNPDGSTDGIETLYPDVKISETLIKAQGGTVSGFIVQQRSGLDFTGNFPLGNDKMPAGDYRIQAKASINGLTANSGIFHYTADKSHLPDPADYSIEIILNTTIMNLNEPLLITAKVTDKNGDPAPGIKVGFRVMNMDRSKTSFYGKYMYLYNITDSEGRASIRSTKNEKDLNKFKAGKYIAQVFIIGGIGVDELQFEFTGQ